MLAGTVPPSHTVVSMDRPIDYRIFRYTTVGPSDDTDFNIWKFTEYIAELQAYGYVWRFVKDFAFNTFLWRGHYPVKLGDTKVMLPLHSVTAFVWGILVSHDFNKFPSFCLFSIGWFLLACNEEINKDPNPWRKRALLPRGKNPSAIAPYQRLRAISNFEDARRKRDKWEEKEREALDEQHRQMQKTVKGLGEGNEYNNVVDITTGSRQEGLLMRFLFPLKPVLYPIQQQMRQIVISCRVTTSIFLWEENNLAFWIVTASFLGSLLTHKIPFSFLIRWVLRVSAWVFLGPWMHFAHRWIFPDGVEDDLTDEERDEQLREEMKKQYESLMDKALNYQIMREDLVKLESMKSYMVGTYILVTEWPVSTFTLTTLARDCSIVWLFSCSRSSVQGEALHRHSLDRILRRTLQI